MISTGYFPYAQYVRDYNPPPPVINPNSGNQLDPTQPDPRVSSTSPMYSTISNTTMPNRQSSLLNVTDPRYSATYGNPLLRQVCIRIFYSGNGKNILIFWYILQCTNTAPRSMQYSTFMPGPVAPPQLPISNNVGTLPYNTYISLPMSSRNQVSTYFVLNFFCRYIIKYTYVYLPWGFSRNAPFLLATLYIGEFITIPLACDFGHPYLSSLLHRGFIFSPKICIDLYFES